MTTENDITLRDFLSLFNFRWIDNNHKNGTHTIRIQINSDISQWFEFGINDWTSDTMQMVDQIFSEDLLSSKVESITNNQDGDMTIVMVEGKDES